MDKVTTTDLLLSTKDKLSAIQEQLDELGALTYIAGDKNIDHVRYVLQAAYKKPELDCVVEWNNARLKGIINNILLRMNLYIYGRESGRVLRDSNGNSYIDISEYSLSILDGNQDKFRQIADKVLNDRFVLEFLANKRGIHWLQEDGIVRSIELFPANVRINGEDVGFDYHTSNNTASFIGSGDDRLTDELLHELLNAELNREGLSSYQMQYIESSPSISKEIIIPRFCICERRVDFGIEEDDKRLSLIIKK